MAKIPQAARLAQLPVAEQYAAVELFRGTMVRHSVVAYRRRQPWQRATDRVLPATPGSAMCRFAWPDTICVQERLPPGAAAVLINRTHTYTDIYLPIDAQQKKILRRHRRRTYHWRDRA